MASSDGFTSWEGWASSRSEAELRGSCGRVAEERDPGDGCCGLITEMELFSRLRVGPAAETGWLDEDAMGPVEWFSKGEAMGLADRLSEGETGMSLL